MKRLFKLTSFICFLALAACSDPAEVTAGDSPQPASAVSHTPAENKPASPPPLAPTSDESLLPEITKNPWTGDLDTMEKQRVIRMLTVYGPGRYYLEDNGEEKGLVKEMATRFEQFINERLERGTVRVQVAVIPIARNQLIPALLAGQGDIVNAGLSITTAREELVDFSIPASKPLSEILVTGPSAEPIASIEDLSGKTVSLRQSSSYFESVEALNQRLAEAGKAPVKIKLVSEFLEDDDLIEMVNKGLLPWAIVDDYKLELWTDVFTNLVPREDIVFRQGGQLAWAFRENSTLLEAAVNDFLKKNREGTMIGNVLRHRYIRDFDWAANALNDDDYKRFVEFQHLFQRYGEKYEVDYLFAAAQGYQESRLNQSARSHAGAIGVMQLLPSTASDKHVNIPNIDKAEPNIEAGIKYLNFLRNRYFDDPEIDEKNQIFLALGAYNAGPARMIKMRRKAAELGYDPNVWFDNVELVAAKEIGRETVQYVANIYKYYMAYRFTLEQQSLHAEARKRAGISSYRTDPN